MIKAQPNPVDLWAWTYADILKGLFETEPRASKYTLFELREKLGKMQAKDSLTDEENQAKDSLVDNIGRLEQSQAYKDKNEEIRLRLRESEKQLFELIDDLPQYDGAPAHEKYQKRRPGNA
jgi:hypothetical protein